MRRDGDATAATVIEALGDPVRRKVVELLGGGPRRAGEIAAARAWLDEILAADGGLESAH